jgi:pantoate--beta-alanine ligase
MSSGPRFIFADSARSALRNRPPKSLADARRRVLPRAPQDARKNIPYITGPKPVGGFRYTQFPKAQPSLSPANMTLDPGYFLTLSDATSTRDWVAKRRIQDRRIGLVPTMGALHEGHLDLARRAAEECEDVVVSIYVNPTQFGVNEDLSSYPQSFRTDLQNLDALNTKLEAAKSKYVGRVRAIFNPHDSHMYPFGYDSQSRLMIDPKLTGRLEGASRPTFFQGVTTVVLKLLNIVQPDRVYFGQKDIQQLVVIQRMIDEFHIPTLLRAVPTTREPDGLALSSRNIYLGARRRKAAPSLRRILNAGVAAVSNFAGRDDGMKRQQFLDAALSRAMELQQEQQALPPSERVRFELDYLSLAHPQTLAELDEVGPEGAIASGALILLPLEEPQPGERLGLGDDAKPVRLIDNIVLGHATRLLGLTDLMFRPISHGQENITGSSKEDAL